MKLKISETTYTRDQILSELCVPPASDAVLLGTSFAKKDRSRVYDWRNYVSYTQKEWVALPEIKRLFIYIDAYKEAMREEWD